MQYVLGFILLSCSVFAANILYVEPVTSCLEYPFPSFSPFSHELFSFDLSPSSPYFVNNTVYGSERCLNNTTIVEFVCGDLYNYSGFAALIGIACRDVLGFGSGCVENNVGGFCTSIPAGAVLSNASPGVIAYANNNSGSAVLYAIAHTSMVPLTKVWIIGPLPSVQVLKARSCGLNPTFCTLNYTVGNFTNATFHVLALNAYNAIGGRAVIV